MGVFVDKPGSAGILWPINFILLNTPEFNAIVNRETLHALTPGGPILLLLFQHSFKNQTYIKGWIKLKRRQKNRFLRPFYSVLDKTKMILYHANILQVHS